MACKLRISSAERRFCLIAILISVFSATLRAQTPGEIDASQFSSSTPPLSLCGESADESSPNSTAVAQSGSNQNDANGSNSDHQEDWVQAWMRKVAEARASQPHFVSPIVTTHVMLVQQYRYGNLELWRLTWPGDYPCKTPGSGNFSARLPRASIKYPGWIWRPFVSSEVSGVFRNGGQGRLLCGILSWRFASHGNSAEWLGSHRLVPHFRSREGHWPVGRSEHNWRESSSHGHESPGPNDRFQYRR